MKAELVGTRKAATTHLALHRNTASEWLKRYEDGGLDGLLYDKKRGAKSEQKSLPPSVFDAFKKRLADSKGFGGYIEIQLWLAEEFDIRLPYRTVHGVVRDRLGAKLKRPRPGTPFKKSRSR